MTELIPFGASAIVELMDADRVLIIGADAWWRHTCGEKSADPTIRIYVEVEAITPDLVESIAPALVVAPLMVRGHDAVDIASRLQQAAFEGLFLVLVPPLPDPLLVEEDLRREVGGVQIKVYSPQDRPRR